MIETTGPQKSGLLLSTFFIFSVNAWAQTYAPPADLYSPITMPAATTAVKDLSPIYIPQQQAELHQGKIENEHLISIDGSTEKFVLHVYTNENLEKEVSVTHVEERMLYPDQYFTVMIGRDLDGDDLFDAWFYYDKDGVIQSQETPPATDSDGWDKAQFILQNYVQTDNRWVAWLINEKIASWGSVLSVDKQKAVSKMLLNLDYDLLDLEIKIRRLELKGYSGPELDEMKEAYKVGTVQLLNMTDTKARLLGILPDYLFDMGAMLLVEWGLNKLAIGKLMSKWAKAFMGRVNASFLAMGIGTFERSTANSLKAIGLGGVKSVYTALKIPVQTQIKLFLRAATAKNVLRDTMFSMMQRGLKAAGSVVPALEAGVKAEWKIMAINELALLLGEGHARKSEIYDPNPIIWGKDLAANAEFRQDFALMSTENIGGMSILNAMKGRAGMEKMIACGIFTIASSIVMNLWVKKDIDPRRTEIDTVWDLTLGNTQNMANQRFRDFMVRATGGGKLSFLGYGFFVLIDEGAGYYAYENAVDWHNRMKKLKIKIIPIYRERQQVATTH